MDQVLLSRLLERWTSTSAQDKAKNDIRGMDLSLPDDQMASPTADQTTFEIGANIIESIIQKLFLSHRKFEQIWPDLYYKLSSIEAKKECVFLWKVVAKREDLAKIIESKAAELEAKKLRVKTIEDIVDEEARRLASTKSQEASRVYGATITTTISLLSMIEDIDKDSTPILQSNSSMSTPSAICPHDEVMLWAFMKNLRLFYQTVGTYEPLSEKHRQIFRDLTIHSILYTGQLYDMTKIGVTSASRRWVFPMLKIWNIRSPPQIYDPHKHPVFIQYKAKSCSVDTTSTATARFTLALENAFAAMSTEIQPDIKRTSQHILELRLRSMVGSEIDKLQSFPMFVADCEKFAVEGLATYIMQRGVIIINALYLLCCSNTSLFKNQLQTKPIVSGTSLFGTYMNKSTDEVRRVVGQRIDEFSWEPRNDGSKGVYSFDEEYVTQRSTIVSSVVHFFRTTFLGRTENIEDAKRTKSLETLHKKVSVMSTELRTSFNKLQSYIEQLIPTTDQKVLGNDDDEEDLKMSTSTTSSDLTDVFIEFLEKQNVLELALYETMVWAKQTFGFQSGTVYLYYSFTQEKDKKEPSKRIKTEKTVSAMMRMFACVMIRLWWIISDAIAQMQASHEAGTFGLPVSTGFHVQSPGFYDPKCWVSVTFRDRIIALHPERFLELEKRLRQTFFTQTTDPELRYMFNLSFSEENMPAKPTVEYARVRLQKLVDDIKGKQPSDFNLTIILRLPDHESHDYIKLLIYERIYLQLYTRFCEELSESLN